ncbi:hypothetical protein ACE193_02830 [Bernardetia sp. OM2101]|uniref:hypothetical protein n=1 Tax=Bernardetia sp. OM2101 TaxID=3344876 RepID=UPI0035D0B665
MNIHKINSHLHKSFLEEERKDAITGDLIQANDEVVFCAVCKSAFFKDSWEYMDRKHCGQTKTLNSVPISKPLLLNVSIIKPHFITLTTSSVSFEKYLEMLSDFNPRDKKVEIRLDPILKKGTEQYNRLLEKAIRKPERKTEQEIKIEKKGNWEDDIMQGVIIFVVFAFITAFPLSAIIETTLSKVLVVISYVLVAFLFVVANKYNFFSKKKVIRNDNENSDNSITFGIFNHSLFFYFEEIQQGIFIELTRIGKIEIQYQSSCCINLILKKNDKNNKAISIPLIFSKKERITTFLIRLAKTKKGVSNHSQVKLTNFPIDRIRLLKRKLMLYTDIIFEEPKKIEPKKELIRYKAKAENESVSLEKLTSPIDLTKSQKISKQSKNRNHHHQNQHKNHYKNYKRR